MKKIITIIISIIFISTVNAQSKTISFYSTDDLGEVNITCNSKKVVLEKRSVINAINFNQQSNSNSFEIENNTLKVSNITGNNCTFQKKGYSFK